MIKTIQYDAVDREILSALSEGVSQYENTAETRAASRKKRRVRNMHKKNSELKKLAAFGRV